ncbi:MAG: mobilization protein [Pseudomonadota bacterium]
MAETELQRAEKRYAQAKARLQALRNREATKQRKLDTRRKVILGGALLDLAERDSGASAMVERLIRNLSRDQDRKAFTEWDGAGSGGDGSAAAGGDVSPPLPSDPDRSG